MSPEPVGRGLERAARRRRSDAEPAPAHRSVSLEYRTPERVVRAAHRIDLDVYEADRFVLLGPSGCGKV